MPLTARRPSQEIVDIVGALGGTWSGNVAMCRCPAHSDRDPSLSIRQGIAAFSSPVSQDARAKTSCVNCALFARVAIIRHPPWRTRRGR